jgi:hypothetical protein
LVAGAPLFLTYLFPFYLILYCFGDIYTLVPQSLGGGLPEKIKISITEEAKDQIRQAWGLGHVQQVTSGRGDVLLWHVTDDFIYVGPVGINSNKGAPDIFAIARTEIVAMAFYEDRRRPR